MAEIGSLEVRLSLNAENFNNTISQANRHIKSMGSELQAVKGKGADYEKSITGLTEKKGILTRAVEASSLKLQEERKRYDELTKSGTATEKQIEQQAIAVNRAQAEFNRLSTQLTATDKELKVQSSSWTQLGAKLEPVGEKMKSIGKSMTDVGKSLSLKVTAPLVALGAGAFKTAVDFESAFAGVRKTVDATEEEFQVLSDGIRSMSKEIPAAATEIAGVAEAAGQLGIQKESILGFTRTMVDLGVATNMGSDEAATSLARLANITQMNQNDFDRLGSSVVDLGNNFATTEREIVDMSLRLAGAGAQVGMSEADILALATALSSVGIEAEMGGSAISRVMVEMQVATSTGFSKVQQLSKQTGMSLRDLQMMASHNSKGFGKLAESLGMTKKELTTLVNAGVDLEGFSKIAGMTGDEFKRAFEQDAIGALGAFINGLANAEEAGESAINMLQEMGITEIRLRDSLLRAGGASELFANAVKISNEAWEENVALTNEAEERYKTTESQMKILVNQIKDVGITIGGILIPIAQDAMATIKPWVERFGELEENTQKNILAFGAFAAAAGPLIVVGGSLMSGIGGLITTVGALSTAIGAAGGASAVFGGALTVLTGPVGIAVGTIAGLTAGGIALYNHLKQDVIPEVSRFGDGVSESTQKVVGAFMDMSEQANGSLKEMVWSQQTVTQEMAADMSAKQQEITTTLINAINERQTQEKELAREQLRNLQSLSDEQKNNLIQKLNERFNEERLTVEDGNAKIQEIYQRAANNNRRINEAESAEILAIRESMTDQAIKVMSENELEQKLIYERIKENASTLSAMEAAEVVKNATQKKNDVIVEANAQFDETEKWAVRQRDELGTLSADEAKAVIEEARKKRDEAVSSAEDMHQKVVSHAKEQASEHVNHVNWETGEVLSKWEYLKNQTKQKFDNMAASMKSSWTSAKTNTANTVSNIVSSTQQKFQNMQTAIDQKMQDVKNSIQIKWNIAQQFLSRINLKTIGQNIIQGLVNGIRSKMKDVQNAIKDVTDAITNKIKAILNIQSPSRVMMGIGADTGQGLAIGIQSTKSANQKAVTELGQVITDVSRKNAEDVLKISDDAEKKRTALQQEYAKKSEAIGRDGAAKRAQLEEEKYNKLAKINDKASADMVKKENELSKKRLEAVKLFVENKKSLEQLSLVDEVIIWQTATEAFKANTKEKVEAQKAYAKALDEVNKEITSINKKYADEMQKINDDFRKQEEDLTKKYQDTLDSRMKSLYNFAGVFDEFDTKVYQSGVVLLENLRGQVKGFEDWQTTIEKLAKRAIDDGLIAELTAMGPKALGELQALNSMTDDQLSEYSALYREKQALARSQAEAELIGMKNDTEKQISQLRAVANNQLSALQKDWQKEIKAISNNTSKELTSLKKIGEDAVRGLIEGMKSMHPDLKETANSLAKTVSGTVKDSLKIKSPSRLMMEYGEYVSEGLAIGIGNKARYATDAAKQMVQALDQMLVDGMSDINTQIIDIENRAAEESKKTLENKYAEMDRIDGYYRNTEGRKTAGYYRAMEDLEWDTKQELIRIEEQKAAEIEKIQSRSNTLKLEDVKKYFDAKKKAENLSYMDELFFWEKTIQLYEDGSAEKIEIQKEYQKVVDQITQEIDSINEQHANKVLEINDRLKKDTDDLTNAYLKSVDDRAKSLVSFAGVFDEFKIKQEKSGIDLLANLQSQVDGFKSWQESIAELSAKAIDEGLLAELRAMGPKAAGEIEALNSLTEAQLEEYSRLYQEKQALAREQAEAELVGMKDDTEKRIEELRDAANAELDTLQSQWVTKIQSVTKATDDELAELKGIGVNAGQGLLDGLASMEGALVEKARSIAESVKSAMAGAFDIHSPSRWMRDMIGKNMMVGWMDGMESMRQQVLAVARASTEWMTPEVPNVGALGSIGGYGGGSSSTTNNRNYTGNTTINVYAPTPSPAEIARKAKQAQRQMAMEWGV